MGACSTKSRFDLIYGLCFITSLIYSFYLTIYRSIHKRLRRYVFKVLKSGSLPKHIAFVMDGNRRFATLSGFKSKAIGHIHGFHKFEQILEWCFELGIRTVTVYAFSLENFKRPKEEVDTLMRLAIEKFEELSRNSEFIKKNKVGIRIIGELGMLPLEVQRAACNAMYATRAHDQFIINGCFPYTSRAELLSASNKLVNGLKDGQLQSADINGDNLSKLLYTDGCPPVDLVIRTSGEHRLSEFLTWQCTQKPTPMISFVDALWPQFGIRHLVSILLRYHLFSNSRRDMAKPVTTESKRWREFYKNQKELYWEKIKSIQTIE